MTQLISKPLVHLLSSHLSTILSSASLLPSSYYMGFFNPQKYLLKMTLTRPDCNDLMLYAVAHTRQGMVPHRLMSQGGRRGAGSPRHRGDPAKALLLSLEVVTTLAASKLHFKMSFGKV